MQQVLILSSRTGGGHESAARALENSLTSLDPGRILVKITQVLEESSWATHKFAELYNYLLRDYQHMMRYYYWAIHKLKPHESRLLFEAAMGYGRQMMTRFAPQAIVSVHPMTQHFFAYLLKRFGLLGKIPFITVVTDPYKGFWKGWACHDVDRYYVATHEAKQQLLDYGVGSHKITIAGMPVDGKFRPVELEQKRMLRQAAGLDPDALTVFINAGWVGGGNIPKVYETLVKQDLPVQAVFLTGKNQALFKEAQHLAQAGSFPVHIVGETQHMHELMHMSDVMVSKFGGLTTFEALSCRLPILGDGITTPMPQEQQTAHFVTSTGAGRLLTHPDDIVSVIQSFLSSPEPLAKMRQAAARHVEIGASDRIARDVMSLVARPE